MKIPFYLPFLLSVIHISVQAEIKLSLLRVDLFRQSLALLVLCHRLHGYGRLLTALDLSKRWKIYGARDIDLLLELGVVLTEFLDQLGLKVLL